MDSQLKNDQFRLVPFQIKYRKEILEVWERSVLATHFFLEGNDFTRIKHMLEEIDFGQFDLHCLLDPSDCVAGFIGVTDTKIEMLFLDPGVIGKGLGKTLLLFAIDQHKAEFVDVNEQNLAAVAFYKKAGFETYARSPLDDMGYPYPILHMRLRPDFN